MAILDLAMHSRLASASPVLLGYGCLKQSTLLICIENHPELSTELEYSAWGSAAPDPPNHPPRGPQLLGHLLSLPSWHVVFHGLSWSGDQVGGSLGICGTKKRMPGPLRLPETCVAFTGELAPGWSSGGGHQAEHPG